MFASSSLREWRKSINLGPQSSETPDVQGDLHHEPLRMKCFLMFLASHSEQNCKIRSRPVLSSDTRTRWNGNRPVQTLTRIPRFERSLLSPHGVLRRATDSLDRRTRGTRWTYGWVEIACIYIPNPSPQPSQFCRAKMAVPNRSCLGVTCCMPKTSADPPEAAQRAGAAAAQAATEAMKTGIAPRWLGSGAI